MIKELNLSRLCKFWIFSRSELTSTRHRSRLAKSLIGSKQKVLAIMQSFDFVFWLNRDDLPVLPEHQILGKFSFVIYSRN
jgi:hypothetical protein